MNTDMLERYLQAVRKNLPKSRQGDIIRELRDNLLSEIEDKEGALGRPLTPDEMEGVLKSHGHPIVVATRYLPQRHLIGPAVFPFYRYVLEKALLVGLLIYTISNAVLLALQAPPVSRFIEVVLSFPAVAFTIAAWVTLIFAVMEFTLEKYHQKLPGICNWSPRKLPPVERIERKHPLSHDVAGFIVNLLFAVYLLVLVPRHPYLILGPGVLYLKSLPFVVSPMWHASYWLFTGAVGVKMAVHLARIFATRAWLREGLDLAEKMMGIVLTGILFRVHEYVLAAPWADVARYQQAADQVNRSILLGLRIVLMIQALQLIWKVGQILMQRWQGRKVLVF
jgi:hypothetical protein